MNEIEKIIELGNLVNKLHECNNVKDMEDIARRGVCLGIDGLKELVGDENPGTLFRKMEKHIPGKTLQAISEIYTEIAILYTKSYEEKSLEFYTAANVAQETVTSVVFRLGFKAGVASTLNKMLKVAENE